MGVFDSAVGIGSSAASDDGADYSSESSDYVSDLWVPSEASDDCSSDSPSSGTDISKVLDDACKNLVNDVFEKTLSEILKLSASNERTGRADSAVSANSGEELSSGVPRKDSLDSKTSAGPSEFLQNIEDIAKNAVSAAEKLSESFTKTADSTSDMATYMAKAALEGFSELNKDKASEAAKESSKEPVDISKMAEVRKVKNSDNSESTLYYATKEDLQKNQPTLRETATQAKKADGTLIERSVLSDMREHPPEVMSTKLTLTDKQGNTETEVVLRPDTPEAVSHKVSVNKKTNEVNYEIKEGNTSIAYRGVGDNLTTVAVDGRKLSGDEQTNSLKNGEILLSAMKKEMGSDLVKLPDILELDNKGFKDDEKPTGRLVLDNKEYQVKDGILTDGSRNLGKIDASGHVRLDGPPMVTLNQKGEQKFLFEGRDANDQPVVVKSENLKHQLTAEIKNPNGDVTHRISAGYLFDDKGALIGAVDERGNLKASKPETKWTHLNSKLEGSIVEGEVDGKPRHFKLDSSAPSGDIFLKNAATGKPEKHTINMGVLVNSSGDQVGLVKGPRLNNRQEIIGGSITFDSDPKNERPLASLKGAVFNLDIPGSNPIVLRGAVRNDQPALNADGKPNPSAIVDLNKLSKAVDSEHDKVAKLADHKITRFNRISKANIDEIVKEQRSKEQILVDIKNGDTSGLGKVQDLIQKKIEDAKLEKATPKEKALALAEKLATQKNLLEVAPTDVKKIDGSFAYKQQDEHGKVGSATVTIRAGELFTPDNKKMGDLVNKDGVVMISVRDQDPSKPAQLVKLSDLPGVQANLKFSDRVPPENVTWIGVPGGELRSIEQLKKQAEGERELYRLTHDETFRRSTGRYGSVEVNNWKNFDDGQYSKTIAQLDAIKQNGITSKEQFKLLDVTGISESFRPELAKQNAEASKKVIGAHPIETVEAAQKLTADIKFPDTGKVYHVDKGQLYEVKLVDGVREVDKNSCGEIGPGYLVTLRSGEQGKPEVFNLNEKRAVVDITFGDGKRQQLIGMGKPSLNFKGELQTNGLVPREDLERQAKDYIASTSKVIKEYDDKTNVINSLTENAGGFRNALVTQRDSVITDAKLLNRNLDNLFDFKPGIDSDSTNKFDNSVRFTQDLMKSMGVTTRTTELDAQGYEQARQQVAEGVVSGCITVASLGTSSALTFGASLLKAAEISKTTVALASLTGSVWTGGEISAALLSSKAMDVDSARAYGQCQGAANSVSKFFEGVGPLTAIRDTKAAIAALRAGDELSVAQQAIIQNKTLVYNLLNKGVSDEAVYLVAAVSEVGDNALQVRFGAMGEQAKTGKPSTSNEAFSTAVQFITGKTSHGLIDAVPGDMTLVKSTLEQSAQGFKQSLTEGTVGQLSNQRDEQKRELAQRLGIKVSEVSDKLTDLDYGAAVRDSLAEANVAALTAATLSPFTNAVGSLTEHSLKGKNQKETSPSDGRDTNSNQKAMYVVLNDSNSSIPAVKETAKETSVVKPDAVEAERNSHTRSFETIDGAGSKKPEALVNSAKESLDRVTEVSMPGKEAPVEALVDGNKENTEQDLVLKGKVDSILESSNTRDKSESKPESKRDSKGNEIGKEFPQYAPQEFERTRPKILDDLKKWTTLEGSNIGKKFEALTDKLGFSAKEKNEILDGLNTVREHGARMREIDPDQKTNFEHTQREMGAVLDYAERNGFSKEQTQDLLFAAMFSDGLKTKFNFTTHNADGALAFEHFASTHLKDIPADRLAGIKQSILEHQLAPPEFMAMIYSGGIVASFKKEGREMTVEEAAALKTLKEKISNPFALTADELVDVPGPPGAKGVKLTELEQSLLRRTGLDNWYVPNEGNGWNKISRGLIDCDGIDNYFGPGGLAKIILLRSEWGDKHAVFNNPDNKAEISSVQSWIDSGLDFSGKKTEGKLGVATPETVEYTAKLNQSMEKIIDSSRARVNDWIGSAKGREELGLPAQGEIGKIPGWSGTKEHPDLIDSKTATPEDIARLKKIRAAFAEELLLNQRVGMEKTPPYEPLMRSAEERSKLDVSSEAQSVKGDKDKPSSDKLRDNIAAQNSEGKAITFNKVDFEAKRKRFDDAFDKGLVPTDLLNDLPKGVTVNPVLVTRPEQRLSADLENKTTHELNAIFKRAGMISKAEYDSASGAVSENPSSNVERADHKSEFDKFVDFLEIKDVSYIEYKHEETGTSILIRPEDAFHLDDVRLTRQAANEKDPTAMLYADILRDFITVPDVISALDRKIGPADSISEIRLTGVSDPVNTYHKFHFEQGASAATADMVNKIIRVNKESGRDEFLSSIFPHELAHVLHDPNYMGSKHEAIAKLYEIYMNSGANTYDDLIPYALKNNKEFTAVSLGEQLPNIPPEQFKEIINRAIHFNDDSNAALRLAVMANVAEHLLVEPLNSHFFRGEASLMPTINHATLLENIRNTREMIYPVVAEKIVSKLNDSSVSNKEKNSWGIIASEIIGRSIRPELEKTASLMTTRELLETGILHQIYKLGSHDSDFWSSMSKRLEDSAFGDSATKESRQTVFEILDVYDVPSRIKFDLHSKEYSRLDESRFQLKLSKCLDSPIPSHKESAISIFASGQFTERWKAENLVFGPGLAVQAISVAPAERRAELLQTIMRGLDDRPDLQEAVLKHFEGKFFADGKKLPAQVMDRYKEQIKSNELWNNYEKAAASNNDVQLGAAMLDLLAEGLPFIKPEHRSYGSAEMNRELGIKEDDHQYKKPGIKPNLPEDISFAEPLEPPSSRPSAEIKGKVEQRIEDLRRDLSEFVVGIRDNKPVVLIDLLKKFDVVSDNADSRIEHLSQLRANTIKEKGVEAWHQVMSNFAEVMYPNFEKTSAPNKTIVETPKLAKAVAEPVRLETPQKSLQEQLREHFSKSGSLGLNGVPDPREYSLSEDGKAKPNWKRTESGEIFENTDGSRVLLPMKFDSVTKQIVLDSSRSEVAVSKERVAEVESVFKQFHGGYVNNGMVITSRSASELEKELNVPRNTIFDFSERHRNLVEVGSGDSDVIARIRQAREVAQKNDPLTPSPDNAIGFDLIPNEKGSIYQADATRPLPLPENSVDGIITAYSLLSPLGMQRYPERQQSAFDNMVKVLKTGSYDEGGVQNGGELLVGPIIREDLDRMVIRSPFKLEVEPVPLAKADGSAVIQTFIVKKGPLKEEHENITRATVTQSRHISESDFSQLAQIRAARERQNGRPGKKNEYGDELNPIQRDGLTLNDRVEEIPGLSRGENTLVDQVFLRPEFSGQDRSAVNKALADFGLYRTTDAAEMQEQTDKFFAEATYVYPMEQITYLTEQGNKIYVPVEMEGWLSGIRDIRERAKLDPSNEVLKAEVQRDSYAILPEDVAALIKSGLGSENLKEIYLYSGADPKDAFTSFHSDEETLIYASANAATGQVWLNDALWMNNLESYLNHELGHFSKSPQTANGESSLEAARVLEGHGEKRTIVEPYEHVVAGLEGEAYPVIGREGIETMPPRKFMQAVDSLLANPELSNTDIKLVVLAEQLRREIDNKTWSTHSQTGKLSMAPDVDQMRANVNLAYIEKAVYPTVEYKLAYIIAHADYETDGRPEAMVIAKAMGRSSLIERLNVELGSMASDDPYRPKLIEAISELTPILAKESAPAAAELSRNPSEPKLDLEQMLTASDSERQSRLLEAIINPNYSDEYNRDALSLAKVLGGPSLVTELQKHIDAMPLEEFANNPRLLASIAELSSHEFVVDPLQAEFDASLGRTAEVMNKQVNMLEQAFGGIDLSQTREFIKSLEKQAGFSVEGLVERLEKVQNSESESSRRTAELERMKAEEGYPWNRLDPTGLGLEKLADIRKQVNDRLQKTLSVSDDPWGQLVKNVEEDYLLPGLRKPEDLWTELVVSAEAAKGLRVDDMLQAKHKVSEQLKKLQAVDSWDVIVRNAEEFKYGFPNLDPDVVESKGLLQAVIDRWEKNLASQRLASNSESAAADELGK